MDFHKEYAKDLVPPKLEDFDTKEEYFDALAKYQQDLHYAMSAADRDEWEAAHDGLCFYCESKPCRCPDRG